MAQHGIAIRAAGHYGFQLAAGPFLHDAGGSGKVHNVRKKKDLHPLDRRRGAPKTTPSRRTGFTRRSAPRGDLPKVRVTIALDPAELTWAEAQAHGRHLSVSAVFSDMVRFAMRDAAWKRFAAAVGGTSELSEVEIEQTDAEFRELGLIR